MVVASLLLSFWHISTASLHLFPRPNRTDNYGLYRAGVYRRGPRCGHSNTNNDSSSAAAAARRWREADQPSPMLCWRGWASQWPAVRSWSAARLRRSDSAFAAVKLSAPFGTFAKLFDDWAVFRDMRAGDATSSSILFDYAALRHPALARGFAHLRPAGAVVLSMPPPNAAATAPPLMRVCTASLPSAPHQCGPFELTSSPSLSLFLFSLLSLVDLAVVHLGNQLAHARVCPVFCLGATTEAPSRGATVARAARLGRARRTTVELHRRRAGGLWYVLPSRSDGARLLQRPRAWPEAMARLP